jgi:hypothetical protein
METTAGARGGALRRRGGSRLAGDELGIPWKTTRGWQPPSGQRFDLSRVPAAELLEPFAFGLGQSTEFAIVRF